jgi:hypothetical protein
MKRESTLFTKTRMGFSFKPYSIFVIGIVLALVLASCAAVFQTQTPTQTLPEPTVTLTATPIDVTLTPTTPPEEVTSTQTLELTQAPTGIPTQIVPYGYQVSIPTISETQEPIVIANNGPVDSTYIYKYAIVSFVTPWQMGDNYLNLTDLNDSTPENSDIIIEHSRGTAGMFYDLYLANGVTFYYSDLHGMSYDTCLEHFPFTKMDPYYYSGQTSGISTGRDTCVLTKDGHLSIIRLDADTMYLTSEDMDFLKPEVVVTTYRKIVSQALTPFPTETPGPTPVPDRYAGMNLTKKQKAGLDKAAQAFLDAVAAGDRKLVASLMDYPLYYDTGNEEYSANAKDQDEFLSVYGEIFTPDLVKEFKNATLAQNMGIHANGAISLLVPDCLVVFYADGKIDQISKSNVWWNDEPNSYHVTKGDAP